MVTFFSKWLTANHLTTLRVALVPFIYAGMVVGKEVHWLLFSTWLVFLFACLTDYWDGVLARHQGQTTKLGKLLDPVADIILIGSLLVLLVGMGRAPAFLAVILISREFIITGLRSIAAAEDIVEEELMELELWFKSLSAVPTIRSLRKAFHSMAEEEIEKGFRRMKAMPDSERKAVELMVHRLVHRLLHDPSRHLKEIAHAEDANLYLETVNKIFDLKPTQANLEQLESKQPRLKIIKS